MVLIVFVGLGFKPLVSQTFSKETILISTPYGDMKLRLFNETPLHKDNFLKLVKQGFYDSLLFHRVINNFMIQGGDPTSKHASDTATLGNGDYGKWIPAEFNPKIFHKKGMLAAARENDDINPNKESSGCQFYIVMGQILDSNVLKRAEMRVNKKLFNEINTETAKTAEGMQLQKDLVRFRTQNNTDSLKFVSKRLETITLDAYNKAPHYTYSNEQKKTYATIGGTPHLDNNYTVFGEVMEGLEVINKIAAAKTNSKDRPVADIRMKISIVGENSKNLPAVKEPVRREAGKK